MALDKQVSGHCTPACDELSNCFGCKSCCSGCCHAQTHCIGGKLRVPMSLRVPVVSAVRRWHVKQAAVSGQSCSLYELFSCNAYAAHHNVLPSGFTRVLVPNVTGSLLCCRGRYSHSHRLDSSQGRTQRPAVVSSHMSSVSAGRQDKCCDTSSHGSRPRLACREWTGAVCAGD
jgi:hypothetical protein